MRKGFGLPQAIMIIVFVATIAIMGIKYSKISVNHYKDSYSKEQAQLFLQNVKEWAIYQISGHKRTTNCWSGGTIKRSELFPSSAKQPKIDFQAIVKVEKYFLLNSTSDFTTCGGLSEAIQTPESHGMVLLYIKIKIDEPGKPISGTTGLIIEDMSIQRL